MLSLAWTVSLSAAPARSDEPCPGTTTSAKRSDGSTVASSHEAVTSPEVDAARNAPHGRPGIEPPTPEAWIDRISRMRAAGDDAAADRECAALRLRYPGHAIPAGTSRSTGPR